MSKILLGELIGITSIPAYADPLIRQKGIKRGVNFASAAGGILEESGSNLVGILPEYIYIVTLHY